MKAHPQPNRSSWGILARTVAILARPHPPSGRLPLAAHGRSLSDTVDNSWSSSKLERLLYTA